MPGENAVTDRVLRSVWFIKARPYVEAKVIPQPISFTRMGTQVRSVVEPLQLPPVEGKAGRHSSASAFYRQMLLPSIVLNRETSSNWMGNHDDGWVAGFMPIKSATRESNLIYTTSMKVGPGESQWYMGASNQLPAVYVASNQFWAMSGPTTWMGFSLRGILQVAPVSANFGHSSSPATITLPGTSWNVPVMEAIKGGQSLGYGNFVGIGMGDWGQRQRGARYFLLFQLPSWDPILFRSTGPNPPPTTHPGYDSHVGSWRMMVPTAQSLRERESFDTLGVREINFTAFVQDGAFHLTIQPFGDAQAARYSWELEETEARQDVVYQSGAEVGRYHTPDAIRGLRQEMFGQFSMPAGRLIVVGNGAQVRFCIGTEMERYDGPTATQGEPWRPGASLGGRVWSTTTKFVTSWSALKRMAAGHGEADTSNIDDLIEDMISNGKIVVMTYPAEGDGLSSDPNYSPGRVLDIRTVLHTPQSEYEDDCVIDVQIDFEPGYARADGGGPTVADYPKVMGIRFTASPEDAVSNPTPTFGGETYYIQNGLEMGVTINPDGDSSSDTTIDVSETGAFIPTTSSDPRTGQWQTTDALRHYDKLRGVPLEHIAGYAFVDDDGVEKYKVWPMATTYTEKGSFSLGAGARLGQASNAFRADGTGRIALLRKAKAFGLPAMDGYSHFWVQRFLSRYAGMDDTEFAPWRVGIYGPRNTWEIGGRVYSYDFSPFEKADERPTLALATNQFAPQTSNLVLASWDSGLPGNIENVGGESANWMYEVEPGGSVYDLQQRIAQNMGFLLFYDSMGWMHYEPDIFPLMASGLIRGDNLSNILKYVAKTEFLSEDHFSYDNSILDVSATAGILGRHDGVMVIGEAMYPVCSCGRVAGTGWGNCWYGAGYNGGWEGRRYHYVKWGGHDAYNANRKLIGLMKVPSGTEQQARNPMLRKTWLAVSSPTFTTPMAVWGYAAFLANWCQQWWVSDLYQITMIGQPHLWPGDFITMLHPGGLLLYFYIRTVRHQNTSGRFDTTITGMFLPYTMATPPPDASELEWGGVKPILSDSGNLETWF
jgi:hypothetical protein